MPAPALSRSADYQIKDLPCKGYDHAACKSKKTVRSLRRIMALERQSYLYNSPAKDYQPYCPYKTKDKVA